MDTTSLSRPDRVQVTLLSSIPGQDFPVALERQRTLGLRFLDLKNGLWGKTVEQLSVREAECAATLIREADLIVYCLSTSIGHTALDVGTEEMDFRARHDPFLDNALRVAAVLCPRVVRLLAPRLAPGPDGTATARLHREFPWFIGVYRDWVDRATDAGFGVLIENETRGCLLGSVDEVETFFTALERPAARFTWDVQNLWQSGTFPTLEVYARLRPWMGALHLKGGRSENRQTLRWASPLDEASWPVADIVRAVIADGVAPFICLNPSHGEKPPGWDPLTTAVHDLAWLRRRFPSIA